MAVTLVKVYDPATSSNQFLQPDSGKRFVATPITIKNSSSGTISPNILFEGALIDKANQSYNSAVVSSVSECQDFASNLKVASGDSATGCIVFEVPTGNAAAKFQYTPSSGFSSNTGQWLIP